MKEVKKVFIPLRIPKLVAAHLKEAPGNKYSVGIMWENAVGTDMVGVNVYRPKVKGKDFALIGSSSTDTFEDTDLQPGTTYYYTVTTVDSQFNETKYSNEISASIPSPAQVKAEEKIAEEKSAHEDEAREAPVQDTEGKRPRTESECDPPHVRGRRG